MQLMHDPIKLVTPPHPGFYPGWGPEPPQETWGPAFDGTMHRGPHDFTTTSLKRLVFSRTVPKD